MAVDSGVSIIPTEDQDETASVIALLATREQKEGHDPKVHGHETARTLKEQQEYLISAIPGVGTEGGKESAQALRVHREDSDREARGTARGGDGRTQDRGANPGARGRGV